MAMFMGMQVMAQEKQAYAFLSSDGKTLTFYYDTKKNTRQGGTAYALNTGYSSPEWCYNKDITKVVFNSSFKNARPTSTHSWFEFQTNLVTITGISNLNTSEVTSMRYMFCGCISLTSIVLSGFDTSNVTDMSYMFAECFSLESLDVSNFNTSKVTDMSCMFRNCSSLTNLDVSALNTSNVTNMEEMFAFCEGLTSLDVSSLNTSRVKIMDWMFGGCNQLESINLSGFNTNNVTDMHGMFNQCGKLTTLDLSYFKTSKVTDMGNMFWDDISLKTIYVGDGWNTDNLTASQTEWGSENGWDGMFSYCSSLVGGNGTTYDENHTGIEYAHIDGVGGKGYLSEPPVEAYAVLSSTGKTLTFYYDNKKYSHTGTPYALNTGYDYPGWYKQYNWLFEQNPNKITKVVFNSSFKNARPTSTYYWFGDQSKLTTITGISNLNTSKVTKMRSMFYHCSSLTSLDVSNFTTSKVTDMTSMFDGCIGLTSLDVSNFNTSKVTYMTSMFYDCRSLTSLDVSSFDTSKVTDMSFMFSGCSGLTSLDVSGFNTSEVTNMCSMFASCSSLPSLDVSSFNTSEVTNMSCMFGGCSSLPSLDLSRFDTSDVTDMGAMFDGCIGLTSLDLSSFNTSKVTNMSYMFYYDQSLITIYVGNHWDICNLVSNGEDNMFQGCTSLIGENGTTYDENLTGYEYAHIDNTSNPGYLSSVSSLYNLIVAGTQVTAANRDDILGNGIFAYTPASKTLSVKGSYTSNSSVIQTGIEGLTVNVKKDATLSCSQNCVFYQNGGSSTFKGNGSLKMTGNNGILIFNAGMVTIDNMDLIIFVKYFGILGEYRGNSKLTIRSSDVTITPYEDEGCATQYLRKTVLEDCHITDPANYRFSNGDIIDNSDGQFAYSVTIEKDNGITTGGVERLNDNGEMINDKAREEWYTIDGRKLSGKPTKKGVYIHNGKKVMR